MTGYLKVLRDPWRTWVFNRYSWFHHSNLRDFETQVLRMARAVYEERPNVICNMERPWLSHWRFCFSQTLFLVQEQVIKKYLTCLFTCLGKTRDHGKTKLFYPWSYIGSNGATEPPPPPSPASSSYSGYDGLEKMSQILLDQTSDCLSGYLRTVKQRFNV